MRIPSPKQLNRAVFVAVLAAASAVPALASSHRRHAEVDRSDRP